MAARSRIAKPIIISPQAKKDIENILFYLEQLWTQREIDFFLDKLEAFYSIVSVNPQLFGYYNKHKNIRNFALTKQNVIYYRNRKSSIEIITVFDGRQNPGKLKKILK